jgi:hypothetical protein
MDIIMDEERQSVQSVPLYSAPRCTQRLIRVVRRRPKCLHRSVKTSV